MEWRKQFGADSIVEEFEPPEVLTKYWPGGLHGFDKNGCPVWIETPGFADVKGLLLNPDEKSRQYHICNSAVSAKYE